MQVVLIIGATRLRQIEISLMPNRFSEWLDGDCCEPEEVAEHVVELSNMFGKEISKKEVLISMEESSPLCKCEILNALKPLFLTFKEEVEETIYEFVEKNDLKIVGHISYPIHDDLDEIFR